MAATHEKSSLEFLKDWGAGLTRWTERYIPDALVIVWILTIITFVMAPIWGNVGAAKAVQV
jgi:short subunit fatty acids transporter